MAAGVAAGVAVKGGKKVAKTVKRSVAANPGGTLLIALAGLVLASSLASKAARGLAELPGEVLDAVIPDSVERAVTGVGDRLLNPPRSPLADAQVAVSEYVTTDFLRGIFRRREGAGDDGGTGDLDIDDEGDIDAERVQPVIVPRAMPVNESIEAGAEFSAWLFGVPFTEYDLRDVPRGITGLFGRIF